MLRFSFAPLALLLALPVPLAAQTQPPKNGPASFEVKGQRSEANLIVIDLKEGKFNKVLALACLTYGAPEWKKELADKTGAFMFRLGKDNWAILDHSAPIDFGGKTVPAGTWYVCVARDAADKWSLVLCDPAKVKAAGVWPNAADQAPRAHEIPLQHEKLATDANDKLAVEWQADKGAVGKGKLTITWGNQKATTPYEVKVDATKSEAKESSSPKK